MTKFLFITFLLLFFLSCQNPGEKCTGRGDLTQQEVNCEAPSPDGPSPFPVENVPEKAFQFDAEVKFLNFEREQEEKVHKALEIIRKVIVSSEFASRVIHHSYQGEKTFVDNKGLTNEEIYQIVLDGQEDLVPEVDHEMDLELELYYSGRNTVGYTYPNTLRIWMNTKYFDVYSPAEVAGNIFHEWTHKLGFDHAARYSESRDHSVPYALGYLIEELGKKYQ